MVRIPVSVPGHCCPNFRDFLPEIPNTDSLLPQVANPYDSTWWINTKHVSNVLSFLWLGITVKMGLGKNGGVLNPQTALQWHCGAFLVGRAIREYRRDSL